MSLNSSRKGMSTVNAMKNQVRNSAASMLSMPYCISGMFLSIFCACTRMRLASRCTIIPTMHSSTASSSPSASRVSARAGGSPASVYLECASDSPSRELARMDARGSFRVGRVPSKPIWRSFFKPWVSRPVKTWASSMARRWGRAKAMSMIESSSSSLIGWMPFLKSTASISGSSCRYPTSEITPRPIDVAGRPSPRRYLAKLSRKEFAEV